MFRLDGKVAAITGATRGIGRQMALALAEAGAQVALLQRNVEDDSVQKEIKALGQNCIIVPCNLEDQVQVKATIPTVVNKLGQIDILVNNAGI